MKNSSFIAAAGDMLPDWVTASFPIIRIVMIILMVAVSLGIIGAVLMQRSGNEGLGAISGQSTETYYAKHKKQTFEGVIKKLTIVLGITAAVIALLFFITLVIYPAF